MHVSCFHNQGDRSYVDEDKGDKNIEVCDMIGHDTDINEVK
jgi:hypothetical protein